MPYTRLYRIEVQELDGGKYRYTLRTPTDRPLGPSVESIYPIPPGDMTERVRRLNSGEVGTKY